MGFKWKFGLSREPLRKHLASQVVDLLVGIEVIIRKWINHMPSEVKESRAFQDDCDELFEQVGPYLFLDDHYETSDWLVDPRRQTWNGLYTKRLVYKNRDDWKRYIERILQALIIY